MALLGGQLCALQKDMILYEWNISIVIVDVHVESCLLPFMYSSVRNCGVKKEMMFLVFFRFLRETVKSVKSVSNQCQSVVIQA